MSSITGREQKTSLIRRVPKQHFTIIRQEYMVLCKALFLPYKLSQSARVGAALINYFESRANATFENNSIKPEAASAKYLQVAIMGIGSLKTVKMCMKALGETGYIIENGVVGKTSKGFDNRLTYCLNVNKLNEWLINYDNEVNGKGVKVSVNLHKGQGKFTQGSGKFTQGSGQIYTNVNKDILKDNYNNNSNDISFVEKLDDSSKNNFQEVEIINNESSLKNSFEEKRKQPPVAVAPLKENAISEIEALKAKLAAAEAENERLSVLSDLKTSSVQTGAKIKENALSGKKTAKKSKRSAATDEVIDYLNLKAGTRYQKTTATTVSSVAARIEEYGTDVLKAIIDAKCAEWSGTHMQKYLRPNTLFNKTNCENYANNLIQVTAKPVQETKNRNQSTFNPEKMAALGRQVNEMAASMGM